MDKDCSLLLHLHDGEAALWFTEWIYWTGNVNELWWSCSVDNGKRLSGVSKTSWKWYSAVLNEWLSEMLPCVKYALKVLQNKSDFWRLKSCICCLWDCGWTQTTLALVLQTAEINLLNLIFSPDTEETDCCWNGLMGPLQDIYNSSCY